MKNAIIINGTTYELVPSDTDEDVCETCALRDMCRAFAALALCVSIHNAEYNDHYIEHPKQKGGEE